MVTGAEAGESPPDPAMTTRSARIVLFMLHRLIQSCPNYENYSRCGTQSTVAIFVDHWH
jgi:hypothetical protein